VKQLNRGGWFLPNIGKQLLLASLPEGSAWTPKVGGKLDLVYDAIGEILDEMNTNFERARYVRDPEKTDLLEDLERDYGILTNELLTEAVRRASLNAKKNQGRSTAAADYVQSILQGAGFDVQVHRNDPPVDPAIFLNQAFQMVAGGGNAYAGRPDAFAARIGGDLLVNGGLFTYSTAYAAQAGGATTVAGNSEAVAGYFESLQKDPVVYEIPTDPDKWGFVFFVGGDATRNVSGELTDIEAAQVPSERRDEFNTIILSLKPLFTWAGLIIVYN
jgi:hypothetical protein